MTSMTECIMLFRKPVTYNIFTLIAITQLFYFLFLLISEKIQNSLRDSDLIFIPVENV